MECRVGEDAQAFSQTNAKRLLNENRWVLKLKTCERFSQQAASHLWRALRTTGPPYFPPFSDPTQLESGRFGQLVLTLSSKVGRALVIAVTHDDE